MAGHSGQPTKLNAERQKKLCDAIRDGNYYVAACNYAGVKYATFINWMNRGRQAQNGPFREFFDAIQKARADAEVEIVTLWKGQMPEDWRAARDFLARRYPQRWGPKGRHEHEVSGPGGGPILITVVEVVRPTPALTHEPAPVTTTAPSETTIDL